MENDFRRVTLLITVTGQLLSTREASAEEALAPTARSHQSTSNEDYAALAAYTRLLRRHGSGLNSGLFWMLARHVALLQLEPQRLEL